ncbi:hypothetical protein FACS189413_14800 [Bacteroidia bacterium]|nr:hypothetical protein FACS189413_14800 [Bacteroidia bacterium]
MFHNITWQMKKVFKKRDADFLPDLFGSVSLTYLFSKLVIEVSATQGKAKLRVPLLVTSEAFKSKIAEVFGLPVPPILTCAFTFAVPNAINNSVDKNTFFIILYEFVEKTARMKKVK